MYPKLLDKEDLIIIFCMVGLLACVAYLLRLTAAKYGSMMRSRRFAHFAEPILLLLAIPLLVGWPIIAPAGAGRLTEDALVSVLNQPSRLWTVVLVAVTFTC